MHYEMESVLRTAWKVEHHVDVLVFRSFFTLICFYVPYQIFFCVNLSHFCSTGS